MWYSTKVFCVRRSVRTQEEEVFFISFILVLCCWNEQHKKYDDHTRTIYTMQPTRGCRNDLVYTYEKYFTKKYIHIHTNHTQQQQKNRAT